MHLPGKSQGFLEKAPTQPGSSSDPEVPLPAQTITFTRPAKTVKEQSEMRPRKEAGPERSCPKPKAFLSLGLISQSRDREKVGPLIPLNPVEGQRMALSYREATEEEHSSVNEAEQQLSHLQGKSRQIPTSCHTSSLPQSCK